MLAVLVHTNTRLQTLADILVVVHCSAVAIEYLDDRHIGKVCVRTLTLLLQRLLKAQDMFSRRLSRINTLGGEPLKPQVYLALVVALGGWQSVTPSNPLLDYLVE